MDGMKLALYLLYDSSSLEEAVWRAVLSGETLTVLLRLWGRSEGLIMGFLSTSCSCTRKKLLNTKTFVCLPKLTSCTTRKESSQSSGIRMFL